MSTKVMRLIDQHTGLMECRYCGARHSPNVLPGGRFPRGSWQCSNGCKPPAAKEQRTLQAVGDR